MHKIAIVVTNRASYGRLKSVIDAIHKHDELELQLITTDNIKVEYPVSEEITLVLGDNHKSMIFTTTTLTNQLVGVFSRLKPDILLIHGDRFEMLGVAMAASYLNIPIAHTEGGECSGCIDDKVRYAISSLADIHFPVTEEAANRLIYFVKPENVYVVGSTSIDTVIKSDLTNNHVEPYILVLNHPNTTEKEDIEPLIEALESINIHKIWVNPNFDAGSKEMLKEIHKHNFEFVKDLPPEEYYRLLANCECAVGNSSSFIKEGAFIGTKAVIVGNRQKNREHHKNVIFSQNTTDDIKYRINLQLKAFNPLPSTMFGDGATSRKIVDYLISFLINLSLSS